MQIATVTFLIYIPEQTIRKITVTQHSLAISTTVQCLLAPAKGLKAANRSATRGQSVFSNRKWITLVQSAHI